MAILRVHSTWVRIDAERLGRKVTKEMEIIEYIYMHI